ncbi:MAG: DNA-processing protein DprA, partial [Bacteroidota bacterium]
RLRQINDAPSMIYSKGNTDFENSKVVAIVGTRKSTPYGRACVEEFINDLTPHRPLIVSGLAYGIDITAHKQALKNNLPTVGVMGSGIDVVYPAAHKDIARRMTNQGGLVTEHAFGTQPDAHNFPARNRIVAGLSDAIVVVEAAERGGALITAEIANTYNKDVFAFPGNIGQHYSTGCNNLIKGNKAHLITSASDLAYIMDWTIGSVMEKKGSIMLDQYEPNEQTILKVLLDNKGQLMIDEISWRTNLPVSQLASLLLNLEFKGVLTSMPGKVYKLSGYR